MKEFFTSRFQTISDYFATQSFGFQDFGQLFSWDFWSENNIFPTSTYTAMVLTVAIVMIVGILLWRRQLKRKHQETPVYNWPLNQLANLVVFIILITLTYWFFRSQQLAYLSSRLVILVSIIVTIVWLAWITIYIQRTASAKREAYLEKERFFRYLPKSKKARS